MAVNAPPPALHEHGLSQEGILEQLAGHCWWAQPESMSSEEARPLFGLLLGFLMPACVHSGMSRLLSGAAGLASLPKSSLHGKPLGLCASLQLTCGLHRQQLARQSVHLQTAEGVARGQQGLAVPTGGSPVQEVQGSGLGPQLHHHQQAHEILPAGLVLGEHHMAGRPGLLLLLRHMASPCNPKGLLPVLCTVSSWLQKTAMDLAWVMLRWGRQAIQERAVPGDALLQGTQCSLGLMDELTQISH